MEEKGLSTEVGENRDVLGHLVYIQEFCYRGKCQWLCPECGYTNIELREGLEIGQTKRCSECERSYTRTIGRRDGEIELLTRGTAEVVCKLLLDSEVGG